ncbi:sensor histidine kinase [Siccirubricoccus sp. G192]|uniref:sensor histidine kinase n=1 Tax=Siccirubricoccus sp. G192 TaxID=2849651 RepID=UPI001C2C104C|nr:sensor histidine kinase [Siccirubricoccus sp. G192]MBV1799923.1 sensor histidine kinase [Siccirubricoccus sp. G192]
MGSLTRRVALLASLWVAVGLGFAGWFVSGLAERHIEQAADARLSTMLDAVVAAAAVDAAGRPRLDRPLPDPEFERPLSGRYWQVTGPGGVATSRSLWDSGLPPPAGTGEGGMVARDAPGPRGENLRLLERRVEIPDAAGPLFVQVGVSREATEQEVARLHRGLALAFVLLGAGLVGGLAAQVVWAMRPLRAAQRALAAVRAGERDRLALVAPAEIAPLVEEVDALIAQNRATVERARAHVGNLAHALKTPVAVLRNALDQPDPQVRIARAQSLEIERIVQHHLARARSAALAGAAAASASPLAAAEEVAAALRRLRAEEGIGIAVQGDAGLRVRADRQDLIEMIGNLMENACKWAAARVEVRVHPSGRSVAVAVEDDGPGLPPEQAEAALDRGVRLDEARPGAGLGLAIAADLAALHGGRLTLGRGAGLGGTLAMLELPAAEQGADGGLRRSWRRAGPAPAPSAG